MKYYQWEKLKLSTSVFGMGCMRLPQTDEKKIDRPEAIRMIRHAVDSGVSYIDTAYGYHGGESEIVVGQALQGGYRERVCLASKLPPWQVKVAQDMPRLLGEQLQKLNCDYLDFYLIHSLDIDSWRRMRDLGVLDFMRKARDEGKIKYIGFSFHDNLEAFREIIDAFDWDMCQIQFNFMDTENQAGLKGLKYAGEKGIPVVVMEPLLGGRLARAPKEVQAVWDSYPVKRSPAEWAFRYLYHFPEVAVILSGVSTMEQLEDNIRIFDQAQKNVLTKEEETLFVKAEAAYKGKIRVPCTGCEYCVPCPQNVAIPQIFARYNESAIYDIWQEGRHAYKRLIADGKDASRCVQCGQCESACPQHIPIIEQLQSADANLR